MRLLAQLVIAALSSQACYALPAPPHRALLDEPPAPQRATPVDIALFVRDRTAHPLNIAKPLVLELEALGVRTCLLHGGTELPPGWTEDAASAKSSGVPYLVRVDIQVRREQRQPVHRVVLAPRPASGFSLGPVEDPAPVGFPELASPTVLEEADFGDSEVRHDLRVEAVASVRRAGVEHLIGRWTLSEGALLTEPTDDTPSDGRAWNSVYRGIARILARKIARSLGATESDFGAIPAATACQALTSQ